jgi:hypothetical protein
MSEAGVFGDPVGNSEFVLEFEMNWGRGEVFAGAQDHIGFQAATDIYVDEGAAKKVEFAVSSNNGHRLRVDGAVVLDSWDRLVGGVGYRSNKVALVLQPGKHELGLDFYEWDDQASFSVSVSPEEVSFWCAATDGTVKDPTWSEWTVEWFTVSYDTAYKFDDSLKTDVFPAEFHHDWGYRDLVEGVNEHVGFKAKTDIYIHGDKPQDVTFTLGSDDGSALWVNRKLLIDKWRPQRYLKRNTTVTLDPGPHELVLHYFEWTGVARVLFEALPTNIFASCR